MIDGLSDELEAHSSCLEGFAIPNEKTLFSFPSLCFSLERSFLFSVKQLVSKDFLCINDLARRILSPAKISSFFPIEKEALLHCLPFYYYSYEEEIIVEPEPTCLAVDTKQIDPLYTKDTNIDSEECFDLLLRAYSHQQFDLFLAILKAPYAPILQQQKALSLLAVIHSHPEDKSYGKALFFSKIFPSVSQIYVWFALQFLATPEQIDLFWKYLRSDKIPSLDPNSSAYLFFCIAHKASKQDEWTKQLLLEVINSPKVHFDKENAYFCASTASKFGDPTFMEQIFRHEKFAYLDTYDQLELFISSYLQSFPYLQCILNN